MQKNLDIRKAAKDARINLWEVAQAYGCSDSNFSRKLRSELPPEEKDRIISIIQRLKGGAAL